MNSIIWRPAWFQPEISLWALWSLICIANRPNSMEAVQLLGDRKFSVGSCLRPASKQIWAAKTWDIAARLTQIVGVDSNRVEELLPFDLSNFQDREHLLSHILRYCPDCLRSGYHSTVYQHRALLHCPIHGEMLLNGCYNCGENLPATFSSVAASPLECSKCSNQLGTLIKPEIAIAFSSNTGIVSEVRRALAREGNHHIRNSNFSNVVHREIAVHLSDQEMSKLLKMSFPSVRSEPSVRSATHVRMVLDDYNDDGDFSGIWADELMIYLSVKRHIETKIRYANSDSRQLREILNFGSIEISLSGSAHVAAVAFYKWRSFYDQGDAERWVGLSEWVQNGRVEMQNGLLPRLADLIWESRKANRAVFEHELYATFVYLLLRARKSTSLAEITWQDLPERHALLPTWEIEENAKGAKVLALHCRTNRALVDRLLKRMHEERHVKGNQALRRSINQPSPFLARWQ